MQTSFNFFSMLTNADRPAPAEPKDTALGSAALMDMAAQFSGLLSGFLNQTPPSNEKTGLPVPQSEPPDVTVLAGDPGNNSETALSTSASATNSGSGIPGNSPTGPALSWQQCFLNPQSFSSSQNLTTVLSGTPSQTLLTQGPASGAPDAPIAQDQTQGSNSIGQTQAQIQAMITGVELPLAQLNPSGATTLDSASPSVGQEPGGVLDQQLLVLNNPTDAQDLSLTKLQSSLGQTLLETAPPVLTTIGKNQISAGDSSAPVLDQSPNSNSNDSNKTEKPLNSDFSSSLAMASMGLPLWMQQSAPVSTAEQSPSNQQSIGQISDGSPSDSALLASMSVKPVNGNEPSSGFSGGTPSGQIITDVPAETLTGTETSVAMQSAMAEALVPLAGNAMFKPDGNPSGNKDERSLSINTVLSQSNGTDVSNLQMPVVNSLDSSSASNTQRGQHLDFLQSFTEQLSALNGRVEAQGSPVTTPLTDDSPATGHDSLPSSKDSLLDGLKGDASLISQGLTQTATHPSNNLSSSVDMPTFLSNATHPAEQVVDGTLYSLKNNHQELVLRLNPENLGEVRVHLTALGQDAISAKLIASSDAGHEILQAHLAHLKTSLESQGIQLDHLSVVVAGNSESQTSNNQSGQSHSHSQSFQQFESKSQNQSQDFNQQQQDPNAQLAFQMRQQNGNGQFQKFNYAQSPSSGAWDNSVEVLGPSETTASSINLDGHISIMV